MFELWLVGDPGIYLCLCRIFISYGRMIKSSSRKRILIFVFCFQCHFVEESVEFLTFVKSLGGFNGVRCEKIHMVVRVRITESKDHRIVRVGSDLKDLLISYINPGLHIPENAW